MILIRESHIFELQVEKKFEVCDPRSFFNVINIVMGKGSNPVQA